MKILTIHADFIEFEAKKKAFKGAEEDISKDKARIEECLVVFTAVEKRDEENLQAVLQRYLQEIKNIAKQVNAKNLVLYPYAHLSSSLSSPKIAEQLMKDAQILLKEKFTVSRAPFGWYKSFNLSCKGHPLSELSREFSSENKEKTNLEREYKDEKFVLDNKELTEEKKLALSAAYLVGKAVKELFPSAELGSANFYHDQAYVDLAGVKLKQEDLENLEKKTKELLASGFSYERISDIKENLQIQIKKDLEKEAIAYSLGNLHFIPLFKEPFVNLQKIKTLKILNIASAYWKNNQNNSQLTRIYLVAFDSDEKLEKYLKKEEDAQNRSHLKIGKEQGLFVVSDLVGAGLPLLAPKGMILRQQIVDFLWELHKNKGYKRVWTPHIAKDLLYKTSGHWDKFGDELFKVKGKQENFILKPMNCPHHMQIFDNFSYSYRDMPVRFFEPATVYRDEKSGQLVGLARVRAITQDDGHLFCRLSQITEETKKIVEIVHQFYHTMGMDKDYWVSLSVRGDDKSKYLGEDKSWEIAEDALEKAAEGASLPYKKIKGEAAFYGPKLDFMFKDALGREWQLATIQCDFNLPERFNLSFMNEKSEKERPVVIHRAITGSLERFMSMLIEHFAGKFPLWLSPIQVKVVTISDKHKDFADIIMSKLMENDIRVELDDRVESMGKKVRDAQMEKVNYIVTIGDKELESGTLAVRNKAGETRFSVAVDDFLIELNKEISEREL
jgi:threonyl-tRNA synthetase